MQVMDQADRDALKVCRLQRQALRRIREEALEMRAMQPGMRAVRHDGMPRQRAADPMADYVSRLDEIDRRYMRELHGMVEKEHAARAALDRFIPPPRLYAFLLQYYIDDAGFEASCEAAGVSTRQGQRYKRMVEG